MPVLQCLMFYQTESLTPAFTSPYPSPVFLTCIVFPFGMPTSVYPLTLTGTRLYSHFANIKLPTAHAQIAIPKPTVTNSVGMSTRSAAPSQKSEKRSAQERDIRIVLRTKLVKSKIGVNERRSWMDTKV